MSVCCNCQSTDWVDEASRVLVVGLQGAGKTVLLQQLAAYAKPQPVFVLGNNPATVVPLPTPSTMPTIGTELVKLPPTNGAPLPKGLILREVGGQMQPIWHHYYEEAVAVLYVVDAAQPSLLAEAAMVLFDLLQHPQLQGKPMCIALTRYDQPSALSQSQLDTVLRLHDLRLTHPGRLHVLAVSPLTGEGLAGLMEWLGTATDTATAAKQQTISSSADTSTRR